MNNIEQETWVELARVLKDRLADAGQDADGELSKPDAGLIRLADRMLKRWDEQNKERH